MEMKKSSDKIKKWQEVRRQGQTISSARWRNLRRVANLKRNNGINLVSSKKGKDDRNQPRPENKYFYLPKALSLTHAYDDTVKFLTQFKKAVLTRGCRVTLDFSTLKYLSAGASLVLVAELDRWRRIQGFRPHIKDIEDWDPSIVQLLLQKGFFDILDTSNPPENIISEHDPNLVFIKYCTGKKVTGQNAWELRKQLEEAANGVIPERKYLFRAVSEAMTNVLKHAYPSSHKRRKSILPGRWWLSGSYRKDNNTVTIVFFDQGVGIPKTLPKKYGMGTIKSFLDRTGIVRDDASMIRAAMELGSSRAEMPHRGKGLPDMLNLTRAVDGSLLRILSSRGEYTYKSGKLNTKNHKRSIEGTFIQWDIPL